MIFLSVRRISARGLLLALVFVLTTQPMLVAAQTLRENKAEIDPISALTASGDAYLTSISQAALLGAELLSAIDGINATPAEDLSEEALVQAQGKALAMAEQAAIALGSVDDLAESIEAVSPTLPDPIGVGSTAAAGLPDEMAGDLSDIAGLAPGQVEALGAEFGSLAEARLAVGTSGLPPEMEDQLRLAGFSDGEIADVATALGARGLANGSLASSLAQFRATQDELAGVRTRALMLYVQLLGKQIAVRQVHGIAPRAVTDDELKALAQDELRLLIHVAHLDELWGGDPSLDVGEGDWWFVERYAARAAERLEALTLDSQNRGLVVELLLIHQMRTLAISARSGDPNYVKVELDRLSGLLALQLGDESFVAHERQRTGGLVKLAARIVSLPFLRDRVSWPVAHKVSDLTVDTARQRLDDLGVVDLTPLLGVIPELNENNNQMALLFAAGLPFFKQLEADVLLAALDVLSVINNENVLKWIEAILTGNTDDPALMVASVLFSLLPVIGAIPDIYTLAVDPSIFVKALSLFGIIGSVGDLIGLIPGLQGVGGVSFLGDAAAGVIKTLFRNADEAFRLILNALRLEDAFDVVLDLVKVVVRFVGDTLGSSRDEVAALLREIFEGAGKLWDNFVAFVKRARARLLLKLGIGEGTMLVGRMLRSAPELAARLSDEAIEVIARIGDDLFEVGLRLSDDAAMGLGKLAADTDLLRLETLAKGLRATPSILDDSLAIVARSGLENWSDEAAEGVVKLVTHNGDEFAEKAISRVATEYSDDVARDTLGILGRQTIGWSDDAVDGVAKTIRRVNADIADAILAKHGGSHSGRFVFEWLNEMGDVNTARFHEFAVDLSRQDSNYVGAIFELRYGADTLVDEGVQVFEDFPDGRRGMDFIMNDGRHIEMKNWNDYGGSKYDDMLEQLRRNVGVDELGNKTGLGRYGDQEYEYVFRRGRSQKVIDALCEIARNAEAVGNLTSLAQFTIRFLDWPQVLPDDAGNLPGSGPNEYVDVGCKAAGN